MRGYLWTNLTEEIEYEFAQLIPGVFTYLGPKVETGWNSWHVEKPDRNIRPIGPKKTTIERVRDLRAQRRTEGLCIDCGIQRDPNSKNYCPKHRELDRLKAAAKRARKVTEIVPVPIVWTCKDNRYEAFIDNNFLGYYVVLDDQIRASVMGEAFKICVSEDEAKKHVLDSVRARSYAPA